MCTCSKPLLLGGRTRFRTACWGADGSISLPFTRLGIFFSFFLFFFFFVPTVTGVGGDILALKVRGQQHDWREEELWVGVCCTDQMFSLMSVLNFYRKRGQCQLLCSQLSSIGDGTVSIPVLYCLASLFSAGVYVYRH